MSRVKPEGNTTTSCRQKDSRVSIYERLSRSNTKPQTIFGALYGLKCKNVILRAAIFDNAAPYNFMFHV